MAYLIVVKLVGVASVKHSKNLEDVAVSFAILELVPRTVKAEDKYFAGH